MVDCNGKKYSTFQEAVENGELEGKLEDLNITRYIDHDYDGDDSTFLHCYNLYVELTDHLKSLYEAFPEEYLAVLGMSKSVDTDV